MGVSEVFGAEGFLGTEAEEGSVGITRLTEVLLSPIVTVLCGVVISDALADKKDDAIMWRRSPRGGPPRLGLDLPIRNPWERKKRIECL